MKETVSKIVTSRRSFDPFVDGDTNGIGHAQPPLFAAEIGRLAGDEQHSPPRAPIIRAMPRILSGSSVCASNRVRFVPAHRAPRDRARRRDRSGGHPAVWHRRESSDRDHQAVHRRDQARDAEIDDPDAFGPRPQLQPPGTRSKRIVAQKILPMPAMRMVGGGDIFLAFLVIIQRVTSGAVSRLSGSVMGSTSAGEKKNRWPG